ncbi:hypothetical protein [Streptomyces sp. NL15-2K]|uniref:hypothetical protein n=1 Tax=Streptomyces sp. NL15-2K TaxID=376149 RepID=UPI001C0ECA92|nr:hypothetical protein [Streptomyces sp. NL15-2K]
MHKAHGVHKALGVHKTHGARTAYEAHKLRGMHYGVRGVERAVKECPARLSH